MVCFTLRLFGANPPLRNGLLFDFSLGVSANDVCMVGMTGCAVGALTVGGLSIDMPTIKEISSVYIHMYSVSDHSVCTIYNVIG